MVFNQIYGEVNDKLLYQFYIPIVIFNCWIIYHTVRKVVVLYSFLLCNNCYLYTQMNNQRVYFV